MSVIVNPMQKLVVFEIPSSKMNINKIKKLKINELYVLALNLNVEYSKPILKKSISRKN